MLQVTRKEGQRAVEGQVYISATWRSLNFLLEHATGINENSRQADRSNY